MASRDNSAEEKNSVFIIIPFSIQAGVSTEKFVQKLLMTQKWQNAVIKNKFMYKYITQKLFCDRPELRKCNILEFDTNYELVLSQYNYDIKKENLIYPSSSLGGRGCNTIHFLIDCVRVITFSSKIGMIAFNLHFILDKPDLYQIANSLYFLKKISNTEFGNTGVSGSKITWLALAQALLEDQNNDKKRNPHLDFCFYSEQQYSRANFFVCVRSRSIKEWERELYYLKYGFSQRYDFVETDSEGNYYAPNGRRWGISSEGCVCMLTADHEGVIAKQLAEFHNEYFLMYCLLLHQKYFYYRILMQLGKPTGIKAKNLRQYKADLIDFENDFVFSTITEVPQYQGVYEKLFTQLQLSNLHTDVVEPINNLNKKIIESNEKSISRIGFFVSLLGVFSIIADGHYIINLLFGCHDALRFVIITSIIAITVLLIWIVTRTIKWLTNN